MGYLFEQDPKVFMERTGRIRVLLDQLTTTGTVNVDEWGASMKAIQQEVEEQPLVMGLVYRIKTLGGPTETKHMHYEGDDGEVHPLDLPVSEHPEFMEMQGTFIGRRRMSLGTSTIYFNVGGQTVMLADCDLLRIEEVG